MNEIEQLRLIMDDFHHQMKSINIAIARQDKQLEMLERVFGRILQIELRVDTLEFNCDKPCKPSIYERLQGLEIKIEGLEYMMKTRVIIHEPRTK